MGNRAKILVVWLCLAGVQADAGMRNPFSRRHEPAVASQPSGKVSFQFLLSTFVVAKGSLNGIKGRNLLVDTGSSPTVLDAEMARKLGVDGKAGDIRVLSGTRQGATGVLSSLSLGPITAKSVPVFITDLSFIGKDLGVRIDAVVGLDILGTSSLLIDYQSQQLIFGKTPDFRDSVPFETGPPLVTVTTQIEGQTKKLLVDTAAGGLFIFRDQRRPSDGRAMVALRNVNNISLGANREQIEVSEVRLGTLRRTRQAAYLVRTEDPSLREFDGLLGPTAMGVREVMFDFEHGRLGWK